MPGRRAWLLKFVLALFVTTIAGTIAWAKFIDGHLYFCSDGVCGYPIPADLIALWHDGWPLRYVSAIPANVTINDPDMILEGWTPLRLWLLWAAFFSVSLTISVAFATFPTRHRSEKP